jgi:hypothetical protein
MAHQINLPMQIIFVVPLVSKLERLLQTTYMYFSSSSKRHFGHVILAKLLETKGLKLLHNVMIRWISILSPIKQVFFKYRIMVLKMNDDLHIMLVAKTNLQYFYCIEVVMRLTCTMPLVESIHVLLKITQAYDTFIHVIL